MIDETHDGRRQSWGASANGHSEFPLQNLPFGVFSPPGSAVGGGHPRGGIAIGDMIFDLRAASEAGLFTGEAATAAAAASATSLNPLMALGAAPRRVLRKQVSALLARGGRAEALAGRVLHRAADCWLQSSTRTDGKRVRLSPQSSKDMGPEALTNISHSCC